MAEHAVMGLVSGLGDYKVKKNVLLGGNMPKIENHSGPGGITVQFQEYLGEVTTPIQAGNSSPFDIKTYLINPAVSTTFPWLSQLAANFEQYEIEGMLFGFRTTSADMVTNATNNLQLGTVIMATQYDVADAVFGSKAEMLNYEFSSSVKPSEGAVHMIECDPRQTSVNLLYTSPGAVPTGTDPRLYHLGRFAIATQGFQGSGITIGELHITYQVRLLKPKLWSGLGQTIPFSSFQNIWTNDNALGYLGPITTIASRQTNGLGMTFGFVTSGPATVNFPIQGKPLRVLVRFRWSTTAAGVYFLTNPPAINNAQNGTIISSVLSPQTGTNNSTTGMVTTVFQLGVGGNVSPSFDVGLNTVALPLAQVTLLIDATVVDPDVVS